jgi:hypothetical protein
LRDAQRLERVIKVGFAAFDVAEAAATRTGVAEDHKGGSAALPALPYVWTRRLFADGVQTLIGDEVFQVAVPVASWCADLEPGGFALPEGMLLV